jgi:hypothetical protein
MTQHAGRLRKGQHRTAEYRLAKMGRNLRNGLGEVTSALWLLPLPSSSRDSYTLSVVYNFPCLCFSLSDQNQNQAKSNKTKFHCE